MQTINIYQSKPTPDQFTDKALQRLTEIEIFLCYQKLRGFMPQSLNKDMAIDQLFKLLNPDNYIMPFDMDRLREKLTLNQDFPPHIDELIVYLRYRGFGINKVTKISKKQHYYLKDRFSSYNTHDLVTRVHMGYDWDWSKKPYSTLMERSNHIAQHLFHTHMDEFYDSLDYQFKKNRFYLTSYYNPKDRVKN